MNIDGKKDMTTSRLPYDEWLAAAQKLKEGRSDRVQHLCGEGDVLVIEHNREGFRAYCHRCHMNGFKPHGRQSLDKQLKNWETADAELTNKKFLTLPTDASPIIPDAGLIWLGNGGITQSLIRKYGIVYSAYYSRVFLPVYNNGVLVYYQARAIHKGQTPKYLNPKVNRDSIRFVSMVAQDKAKGCKMVVVTEDILSAIRVGEVEGYAGCSILGTTASAADINFITQYEDISLWFDPDEAGIKCTRSLQRSLKLIGRDCRVIRSSRDPKTYTTAQLTYKLSS